MAFDLDSIALSLPSDEEFLAIEQRMEAQARQNPTCFTHWFPVVEASGVPHPRSRVLPLPLSIQKALVNYDPAAREMLAETIAEIRATGDTFGWPLFIKNSLYSGKHSWQDTCHLPAGLSDDEIFQHIGAITEEWMMRAPEMALFLVVREMLDVDPVFHAHRGMPVTQEFRLFADNGVIEGWQPYWPEQSVLAPSIDDWQARLAAISEPSDALLDEMRRWAETITAELGGAWSVDFLISKDGAPHLIDMAEAHKSYRCPTGYRAC